MARKERHVTPNEEKGGWDSKRENAEEYQSTLIRRKKQ